MLWIDELLPVEVSAQELGPVASELMPSQEQARRLLSQVDSCEPEELARAALDWFRIRAVAARLQPCVVRLLLTLELPIFHRPSSATSPKLVRSSVTRPSR